MDERRPHRAGFSTRAIHDGELPGGVAEQPASTPIWLTADYLYDGLEHYADVINERRSVFVYGRYGNPTHVALHRVMASLQGADAAWSFSSGMAALHTALTSILRAGDHMIVQRTIYGGTFALVTSVFPRYGIDVSLVNPDPDSVASAIRPATRAVLVETLANPTFRVTDVPAVAEVCAQRELMLVVDNTVASPFLFRPLEVKGVSLVVESTTKYVSGHADLIGGSVAGPRGLIEPIRHLAIELGATAGAFEAWLALRGAQTLSLRLQRQCATALALAEALSAHWKVEGVGYSGLPGHPDHQLATRLFGGGYGAMLSFSLHGGYEAAQRCCDSLGVARVGSSFGSLRTEVCHPATTSHRQYPAEERREAGIGDGLIRVAVGGEDPEDLLEDFLQALDKA